MYAFPLLRAKVQCPPLRAATLHRDRLLDWLEANVHRRVMFVVADPGYGKTTLLADFSRRSRLRTLWYRLDQDDANWVSFVHYLVAAGREFDPGFAPNTEALLKDLGTAGPSREAIVDTFLRELPSLVATGPAVLILDDYHLVDEATDVRDIMRELVARAPEGLSLVVLSRRDPALPVARAKVRGEFSTLDTDDLRFRTDETDELFRHTYSRALDPDVVVELSRRTEGWPASLQLVDTALRGRSPSDARSFVANLNGASGELYDYLAEEVVGDLDEASQRFLMRTSLLQAVDAELASLLVEVDPAVARELITRAERLGLLARRGKDSPEVFRYHPLVRDFLETRLRRDDGDAAVAALHRRVAAYAEGRDWHIAAYHYAAAGSTADLHRVLADSTQTIMGSGEIPLATTYLDRVPPVRSRAEFELMRSRMELINGRADAALELARMAASRALEPEMDATKDLGDLALMNLMSVEFQGGNLQEAYSVAQELLGRAPTEPINGIASATVDLLLCSVDKDQHEVRERLLSLAATHATPDRRHYFGVSMLNVAVFDLVMGDHRAAEQHARSSIEALGESSRSFELTSAQIALAAALAHLGHLPEAIDQIRSVLASPNLVVMNEVLWEVAEILGDYIDPEWGAELLSQASRVPLISRVDAELVKFGRAQAFLRAFDGPSADLVLQGVAPGTFSIEMGHMARLFTINAEIALVAEGHEAELSLRHAMEFANSQRAFRWKTIASMLLALYFPASPGELIGILTDDPAYASVLAHHFVRRASAMSTDELQIVSAEARLRPSRWRPPLRGALSSEDVSTRRAAARLLDEVGADEDVRRLRKLARQPKSPPDLSDVGRGLARRLAKPVFVEDLGRVRIRLGSIEVDGSAVRRKALGLLCFLITRPGFSATRDQVLDALWPDSDPGLALNSLNQTIYFLRRTLEPEYSDETSPGYLHNTSEVLWLDQDLCESRSMNCRNLVLHLSETPSPEEVGRLCDLYVGKFALDFAYEEWAALHRENLHASFLEIVERSVASDLNIGNYDRAIRLARRALDIDPEAEPLERALLSAYKLAGAQAAAAEQYGHYASAFGDSAGEDLPSPGSIQWSGDR